MSTVARKPVPFTYEDYCLLPEDGKRYELIEGDFFVSPSPVPLHQTISRRLQFALMEQIERPGHGVIFDAPMDVIFDPTNVVQPDLIILSSANRHMITARAIEGAPDVLVEILSPSSLDRDTYIKRKLYERFAVREYWIVDPEHGFITVWSQGDDGYGRRAHYDRARTLTCPDFPMLSIPLVPIFERP